MTSSVVIDKPGNTLQVAADIFSFTSLKKPFWTAVAKESGRQAKKFSPFLLNTQEILLKVRQCVSVK